MKIKCRHHFPETIYVHRFHLCCLSRENFEFEPLKIFRSEFGTVRNSCSSLRISLSYLHIQNREEISNKFDVGSFVNG